MTRRIARLKPKKIKGRIQVLKALPYRGNMIYVRRINQDIFEFLVVFKNQLYSAYVVMTPRKGQTKLSKDEISQCTEILWAGGEASIDNLLGDTLEKKEAEAIKAFESSRKVVEA